MPRRRKNGRNVPRTPVNLVYRTIQATGGPTRTVAELGISDPTLKRWRRAGVVNDARAVLVWAALVEPASAAAQLRLARRLAGLPGGPRRERLAVGE
jgi:hypothetical protein